MKHRKFFMKNLIQIEYEKLDNFTQQQMSDIDEMTQDFFREIVEKNIPLPITCFFYMNVNNVFGKRCTKFSCVTNPLISS